MLASLQPHVGQLVAPAVQLRQQPIEPRAQRLDVPFDLARGARMVVRHLPAGQASRSFTHSTSSLRVRRVAWSGVFTRLLHPTRPATDPTKSTAAATISAAAQPGITVAS